MPVTAEIREGGRVLRVEITPPWNMADFVATYADAETHMNAVQHKVHAVVLLDPRIQDPVEVLRIRQHPSFWHENSGHVVFVGATTGAHAIIEAALRVARFTHFRFFQTELEGITFIRTLITAEPA